MQNQFLRTELLIGKQGIEKLQNITNLNRQIIATMKTIGRSKVEVAKERVLEINPSAKVEIYKEFFTPDSGNIIDDTIDYIVDAIDTVTAKVELVVRANKLNIPIISSMGTGSIFKGRAIKTN